MSITNLLILISGLFTFASFLYPAFYLYGMNTHFLVLWEYFHLFLQFFTSNFIHWWILHLLANSVFLYIFSNRVEDVLWSKKYLLFFVLNAFFIWWSILFFSSWNTVWISGFCLATLMFYTLFLKSKWDPEYKWWITAIFLNVVIGFYPWISFVWHFAGVLFWAIYFYLNNLLTNKQ